MHTNNTQGSQRRGFVAIMSAIIISAILMVTVIGAGALHMEATLDAVSYVHARESKNLAEACAQEALLQIALSGTASSSLEDGACTLTVSTATSSGEVTITGYASVMHSFARIFATSSIHAGNASN